MKKGIILLTLFVMATGVFAQKYAWVDTDYILNKMSDYKEAQKILDQLSEKWQKEAEAKAAEVVKLNEAFKKEQFLLSEEMRAKRIEEIKQKDMEAKEFQKQKFGVNGELFQKRQELIKPIQERVYKAIKEVAESGGFTFVFDKANNPGMLYADPKADKTEQVLRKLGL
ncbi:MAG: OmpH family outer membrane protein [Bacteroidota bacterium]